MDVFNISAKTAPKATESGKIEKSEPQLRGKRAGTAAVSDSFAASAPAQKVEGFVRRLEREASAGGDVRSDLINSFRALMAVGALDTPAAADAAAEAMLGA